MDRKPVKSSNIDSIGYDAASKTLEICFKNGGVYQHAEVPQDAYDSLMSADSKGSHYAEHFRGKYPHTKV